MANSERDQAPPILAPHDRLTLRLSYRLTDYEFTLPAKGRLSDLTSAVEHDLHVPVGSQKFLVVPKIGLLKAPFSESRICLADLAEKKLTLLAPSGQDAASPPYSGQRNSNRKDAKPPTHVPYRDRRKLQEEGTYTFHKIEPLPYFPNSIRAQQFLERLHDDAGVKAAMAKFKLSVGLLTEMDPSQHTTHDSKTLGLNRNSGQVIELRLRTDRFDGFRDYYIIRNTLCHELAHNRHGDHDRDFWNFTKQIEDCVAKNDWKKGGHVISSDIYYRPDSSDPKESITQRNSGHPTFSEVNTLEERGEFRRPNEEERRNVLATAAERRARKDSDGRPPKR